MMSSNVNTRKERAYQMPHNGQDRHTGSPLFRNFPALSLSPRGHRDTDQQWVARPFTDNRLQRASRNPESSASELTTSKQATQKHSHKLPGVSVITGDQASRMGDYWPGTDDLLVSKFTPKGRFDIAEIRGGVCDYCKLGRLSCVCRKDAEVPSAPKPDCSFSLSNPNTLGDSDTIPKRRKKKIVVKMPRTDNIYREENEVRNEVPVKSVIHYRHKSK